MIKKIFLITILIVSLYSRDANSVFNNLNRALDEESRSIYQLTDTVMNDSSGVAFGFNSLPVKSTDVPLYIGKAMIHYDYNIDSKNKLNFITSYTNQEYRSFSAYTFYPYEMLAAVGYQYHYKTKRENDLQVGILAGYNYSHVTYYGRDDYTNANRGFVSIYNKITFLHNFAFLGKLYYDGGSNDLKRYTTSYASADTEHNSDFTSNALTVKTELSYKIKLPRQAYIAPLIQLNYAYIQHSSIDESGLDTANDLNIASNGVNSLDPAIGLKITKHYFNVAFAAYFNYSYEFGNIYSKDEYSTNKATGTISLIQPGLDSDETVADYSYNTGLSMTINNVIFKDLVFKSSYDYESRYNYNRLFIGFNYLL